jgi:hypothetical protein
VSPVLNRIDDLEDHVALLEHRRNAGDVVSHKEVMAEAKRELADACQIPTRNIGCWDR